MIGFQTTCIGSLTVSPLPPVLVVEPVFDPVPDPEFVPEPPFPPPHDAKATPVRAAKPNKANFLF